MFIFQSAFSLLPLVKTSLCINHKDFAICVKQISKFITCGVSSSKREVSYSCIFKQIGKN